MSLRETQSQILTLARSLGVRGTNYVYEVESLDNLCDAYCKAVDENDSVKKNIYFAAIISRQWFKIDRAYRDNSQLGDRSFFFDILVDTTLQALAERAWQKVTNLNAQTCLNQKFATRGVAAAMYEANLDIHKANINTYSLSTPVNDSSSDDAEKTFGDFVDNGEKDFTERNVENDIVQMFINKNKYVEAVILDTIANEDCVKYTKQSVSITDAEGKRRKSVRTTGEFWDYKVVQTLSKLPDNFEKSFASRYDTKPEILTSAIAAIRKASNQKLYKYLDSAKTTARMELADLYGRN